MTKDSTTTTSQDHDRKHGQDHISNNPRAAKDIITPQDSADDKRKSARELYTNRFTNRDSKD